MRISKLIVILFFSSFVLVGCWFSNDESDDVFEVRTSEITISKDEEGENHFNGRYVPINGTAYVHVALEYDNSGSKKSSSAELSITIRNSGILSAAIYESGSSYTVESMSCGLSDCQVFNFGEKIIRAEETESIVIVFRMSPTQLGQSEITVSNKGDIDNNNTGRIVAVEFVDSIRSFQLDGSILSWNKLVYDDEEIGSYELSSDSLVSVIPVDTNQFDFNNVNFSGGIHNIVIKASENYSIPFETSSNYSLSVLYAPINLEVNGTIISWGSVLSAEKYELVLTDNSGVEYTKEIVGTTTFNIENNNYESYKVRALSGGSNIINSRYSNIKNI